MKQIEYRQRNKNNGQWHYWGCLKKGIFTGPMVSDNFVRVEDSDAFTGLLDENGKKIYGDSDILRLRRGEDPDTGIDPYYIGTLNWIDGRYLFVSDEIQLEMNECLILGKWDGDVIGDVFSTPELLKQT